MGNRLATQSVYGFLVSYGDGAKGVVKHLASLEKDMKLVPRLFFFTFLYERPCQSNRNASRYRCLKRRSKNFQVMEGNVSREAAQCPARIFHEKPRIENSSYKKTPKANAIDKNLKPQSQKKKKQTSSLVKPDAWHGFAASGLGITPGYLVSS